jgi:hypothetical protein
VRTGKPTPRPADKAPAAPLVVWEAYEPQDGDFDGYWLAPRHAPDTLVAFLPCCYATDHPANWRALADLRDAAIAVAADPSLLDRPAAAASGPRAVDFRDYCGLHSPDPLPDRFYGLVLSPMDEGFNSDRRFAPLPFCRFRLRRLVLAHNRLAFTDEDRDEHAEAVVGVYDPHHGDLIHRALPDPTTRSGRRPRRR